MTEDEHAVLVAEDDLASRTATRLFLQRVGYRVGEAADGPGTLREASLGHYDLVLLDLGLPGLDGEEVLARLRRDSGLPVIVLTGRSEETERVRVLDLGADDYVVKPCSLPELEARIRAVLRRGQPATPTARIEHDGLVIDRSAHRVEVNGEVVDLTPKEFDLLAFLGRVARAGVQPRGAARARLGLDTGMAGPGDGHRARAPPAAQARGGPGQPEVAAHRAGHRVPLLGGARGLTPPRARRSSPAGRQIAPGPAPPSPSPVVPVETSRLPRSGSTVGIGTGTGLAGRRRGHRRRHGCRHGAGQDVDRAHHAPDESSSCTVARTM